MTSAARRKGGVPASAATQFKPGQSGNPAGRPKGIKNYENRLSNEQRQQLAAITGGITPLELFISVCRDEDATIDQRIDAANKAAPYMHRKMPIAIEGGDLSKPINFMDVTQLKGLTNKEIELFLALLAKAGSNIIGDE